MKKLFTTTALAFLSFAAFAQNVGIGTNAPNASAKLEITDANRGLLIPRVSLTATNVAGPVAAPATSLLVYNNATAGVAPNNVTPGFYYWDGTKWVRFASGTAGWELLGNSGTVAGTNFLGTTDNVRLDLRTNNTIYGTLLTNGNFGLGTTAPASRLELSGADSPLRINMIGSSNTFGPELRLNSTAIGGRDFRIGSGQSSNTSGVGKLFFYDGNAGVDRMVIDAAGLVGIGLISPTQKLHVSGGSILTDRAYAASTVAVAANTAAFTTGANATTQVRITDNASATANGNLTYGATAIEGQYLWITNDDAQLVSFAGTAPATSIPTGKSMGFVFTGGAWRPVSADNANANDWSIWGNTATNDPAAPATYGTSTIAATENWLGTTDANSLVFGTNMIERMRIETATGDIGIGVANPVTTLDIRNPNVVTASTVPGIAHVMTTDPQAIDLGGALSLGGFYNDAATVLRVFGTIEGRKSNSTTASSSGYLAFKTNNAGALGERMRILNNGFVGIGTSIPNTITEIVHATPEVRISSTGAFGAAGLGLVSDKGLASEWRPAYIESGDNGGFTGRLDVYTNGTGAGNYFTTLHAMSAVNGQVGIGTTAPAHELDVVGLGGATVDVRNSGRFWSNSASGGLWLSDLTDCFIGNRSATHFGFWTSTVGWNAMAVQKSTGYVGIGIQNPVAHLDVDDVSTGVVTVYRGRNGNATGTVSQIGSIEYFQDQSSTIDFTGGSNFSINLNAAAAYNLQLANNSAAKPTSNTWTVASDARLKEDVTPFKDGLATLRDIKPVYFKYTGEAGMPQEYGIGVIAQQLKESAPYMVGTWQYADGKLPYAQQKESVKTYHSVDNGAMTYIAINAIKELDDKQSKVTEVFKNISDFGVASMTANEMFVPFGDDFKSNLTATPVVTITPINSSASLTIVNQTAQGFTVRMNGNFAPTNFNWIAMAKVKAETFNVAPEYSAAEREALLSKVKLNDAKVDFAREDAELQKRQAEKAAVKNDLQNNRPEIGKAASSTDKKAANTQTKYVADTDADTEEK